MSNTKNSFSSVLAQFVRLQTQAIEMLEGMTDAVNSDAESVTISRTGEDGKKTEYKIPSIGHIEAQVKRIDDTVNKLMGLDSSDANIRMADGTFKKIYQSRLASAPRKMENIPVPSEFQYRNNWFFESFLSPLLYIPVDISSYVETDADKILTKRIIVNTTTPDEIEWFDENYNGRNDINYEDLLVDLQSNGIMFFQDEEVKDLPLSVMRYEGSFDVYKYEDIEQTNPDGTKSKRRKYFLNKLTYSDALINILDTIDLKVGDQLISGESIFKIDVIDTANNAITTKRVSGYDTIKIGADSVSIYSDTFSAKEAQVEVGFDERQVVFFKAIDPDFNIVSSDWSDGIAFFSNDLKIGTPDGERSLEQFYRSEVTDFGQQFLLTAKEGQVPAIYGEIPNAPELSSTNLEVVRINDHKLNSEEIESINKKAADKVRLNSEIKELDAAIDKKKNELSNTKFNSDTERRGVKNELDSLTREKTSKSSLYASIVQELAVLGSDKPSSLDKPKYRIRGFFGIPEPVKNDKTGPQYPIQFITEYRYVRLDGSAPSSKQFNLDDTQGQMHKGTYSNWVQIKSDIRKKQYNYQSGLYEWVEEDIENPDINNINQLDIPIGKGERVEIRVRSVSEAGWPMNPLLSEYSNTVSIEFPDGLLTEDESTLAIQQALDEENRVAFQQELDARGLDMHLARSFTSGDKYYAHDSEMISSGFYTQEGNVINLFDKLKSMETEIQALRAKVDLIKGELSVSIVDPDGTKTSVKNGDKVDLFAGYYKDYIDALPVSEQKGAIISVTYKLLLENKESTPLELISRLPGGIGERLPNTIDTEGMYPDIFGTNLGWINESVSPVDRDYNSARRYDIVPVVNNSVDQSETNTGSKISSSLHQSQQLNSQYIYIRHTDIGLKSNSGDLYFDAGGESIESRASGSYKPVRRSLLPIKPNTGNTAEFIWNYATTANSTGYMGQEGDKNPVGGGLLSDFCIHVNHPALNDGDGIEYNELQNPAITIHGFEEDDVYGERPITNSNEATSTFRHAFGINVQNLPPYVSNKYANKLQSKGVMQLNYRNNWKELSKGDWVNIIQSTPEQTAVINNISDAKFPATLKAGSYDIHKNSEYILPDKYGFIDSDRYLIGKYTCGSYLFLSPTTVDQLLVDGTDMRANKMVQTGDGNGIEIPVTFQFRMTDYYGEGNTGTGIIGGYDTTTTNQLTDKKTKINLTYTRAIGLDIYTKDETTFSLDIQVTAKYRRESLAQRVDIIGAHVSKNREQVRVKKTQIKNLR